MPQDIFHLTSAGSVDDGKSTILARLLLDTGSVFEDQLGGIDPRRVTATTIADLLDGLESEREQGITIDVAHRFFDSATRRYHIADSPGHEQYTRNMATAASHADALLLVIDARSGVKPQTLTHLRIAQKLGIRDVVVAINKMDLVSHRQRVFREREHEIADVLESAPNIRATIIPVSGLSGANIVRRSRQMGWWSGPTVLEALDSLHPGLGHTTDPVIAIQYVQRIAGGGRRYLGSLLGGSLQQGMSLRVSPSRRDVAIEDLSVSGRPADEVAAPAEISFTLDKEIDLDRGDVLGQSESIEFTDQFQAELVWLSEETGLPGRTYEIRVGHASIRGTITRAWGVDVGTGERGGEVHTLPPNSLSVVNLELASRVSLSPFESLPPLGRIIAIDPGTGDTLAAGMILHTLRRAENITPHTFTITSRDRERLTGVTGQVFWLTGLSGSGKSTLANEFAKELTARGIPHTVLDGDSLRLGLNRDLGFTEADRVENIRRTAEVAKLFAESGLIAIVSLISPYRIDRESAREIIGPNRFVEVFVDTPLEICEARDPKGLYKKARQGQIPNFTGVNAPYEIPESPELALNGGDNLGQNCLQLIRLISAHGEVA